jgi:hypothetical protein
MSGDKPVDPKLVELLEQAKRELKADVAKSLELGARCWAAQSNEAIRAVSVRLERLEQQRAPNRKR